MANSPSKVQRLSLENFTAFEQATFDFCPGINVLIGANATGKTQVMKIIYTLLKISKDAHENGATAPYEIEHLAFSILPEIFM